MLTRCGNALSSTRGTIGGVTVGSARFLVLLIQLRERILRGVAMSVVLGAVRDVGCDFLVQELRDQRKRYVDPGGNVVCRDDVAVLDPARLVHLRRLGTLAHR